MDIYIYSFLLSIYWILGAWVDYILGSFCSLNFLFVTIFLGIFRSLEGFYGWVSRFSLWVYTSTIPGSFYI